MQGPATVRFVFLHTAVKDPTDTSQGEYDPASPCADGLRLVSSRYGELGSVCGALSVLPADCCTSGETGGTCAG